MKNIYESVAYNKVKSNIIILSFFVFACIAFYVLSNALGYYLGYEPGGLGILGIALIVSGLTSFASYYYSDKIILGISSAKPADRKRYFNFYTVSENLAIGAGLPKPRLYVIEDSAPNAFATGRDPEHAVICTTTGLLEKLSRTELEGVIGHELAHIKNYDIRLMSVVSVLVGSIALLADWLLRMGIRLRSDDNDRKLSQASIILFFIGIVFAILSPLIAQIIQLAISRRREFMADAVSVSITRQPSGLISALKKISSDPEPLEVANKATAHLYIENPFKGGTKKAIGLFANLFNTHPPVEERINELLKMQ